MLNPRDIYIRSCLSAGIPPDTDYFVYSNLCNDATPTGKDVAEIILHISSNKNPKIKEVVKILTGKGGSSTLTSAYALYKDISNRVMIEGLLLNFTVEDISSQLGFEEKTLREYIEVFFNPQDFQTFETKSAFLSLITLPDAKTWFQKCLNRQIKNLKYDLTGSPRVIESKETLEEIRVKCKNEFDAIINITEDMRVNGLSDSQYRLLRFGLDCGKMAAKISADELRLSDSLKSLKEFMESWKIEVKEDTNAFDISTTQDAELMKQYEVISPLSSAKDQGLEDEMFDEE
jgi:hypothetical protein